MPAPQPHPGRSHHKYFDHASPSAHCQVGACGASHTKYCASGDGRKAQGEVTVEEWVEHQVRGQATANRMRIRGRGEGEVQGASTGTGHISEVLSHHEEGGVCKSH